MSGVFLSYRRDDVGLIAGDVADALTEKTDARVFFDLQSIASGSDYQREIDEALRTCAVVVVLLGKDWRGPAEGGTRRIDDPEDVFRKEVETALRSGSYVIPVLVGVEAIAEDRLGALSGLASLQWHRIRLGQKNPDVDRLVEDVRRVLYERRQGMLAGRDDGKLQLEEYVAPLRLAEPSSLSEDLAFRFHVALIVDRPLLIAGSERAGRSEIAPYLAEVLGCRFYAHILGPESKAQDLLYDFDDVRRLHDAQLGSGGLAHDPYVYVEPGIVWWAFDPDSARRRGAGSGGDIPFAPDPATVSSGARDSVLLIDSLDKAPPGVAIDLLSVLGRRSFTVRETAAVVRSSRRIVTVLTADSLRHLDPQIPRTAIVYQLPYPSMDRLVETATPRLHLAGIETSCIEGVADALEDSRDRLARRVELNDFVDIVRAVAEMKIEPEGTNWRILLDSMGLLQ